MKKIRRKIFLGSTGWLIFWLIVFWPIAIIYFFEKRELAELKIVEED